MKRAEAVEELKALWKALHDDLVEAAAYAAVKKTPYSDRALLRAHFALVEGFAYALRQVTLVSLRGTDLLNEDELMLLREERPGLDDQGRLRPSQQFLRFPESLLFSLRCYAKNHGAEFEPDRSGSGWQAMRTAVRIRDRITHPKSTSSLALSDVDLKAFVDAAAWWQDTAFRMFQACDEADAYWRATLKEGNRGDAG